MMSEDRIRKLLDDIKTAYEVGYQNGDLETEAEKWDRLRSWSGFY